MNKQAFSRLEKKLQDKFLEGCKKAVEVIKDSTPVDTKRLWLSTRAEVQESNLPNEFKVFLVAGGIELYGFYREKNILKEVDYAIYLERREGYIRRVLNNIEEAIISEM